MENQFLKLIAMGAPYEKKKIVRLNTIWQQTNCFLIHE
ncbi:hypothetical protein bthur0001_8830 [Bacillus thuringiensis serovar tochigiensis BGSC 4Y1]|nr:hypothetical protein bthur0001_8830 [Bacillus thuringiensis serovar tochigiensis BGSC 4Y1]